MILNNVNNHAAALYTYMWWKDKFYVTYSYYMEDNLLQN